MDQASSPDVMTKLHASVNPQLESFLLLAKTARGAAAKALVQQVLEANGLFVFGELLAVDSIKEMENDPDNAKYFKLLNIFAYGTLKDYMSQAAALPVLTPGMMKKLRHLTVVSLSSKAKYLPYEELLDELDMKNIRELEDLLISAIYSDIIRGRLDQRNSRLEVDWTTGRDLQPQDMEHIVGTLSSWCTSCERILQSIETQVVSANTFLSEDTSRKAQINAEVENILSTIKKATSRESDLPELRQPIQLPAPSSGSEVKPKKSKVKGLRATGVKLWPSKN